MRHIIDFMKDNIITLAHGSGGKLTGDLIKGKFLPKFSNEYLNLLADSAVLEIGKTNIAFTTDSYVVKPIFFPGSDIGALAINGTVNDLAVMGAEALFISCGFIIEEGFSINDLDKILNSIRKAAHIAKVKVVTGDTKVVEAGSLDKIFINTSGIGRIVSGFDFTKINIKPGDKILINGTIADHGIAVLSARENLIIDKNIKSDCASLKDIIMHSLDASFGIKFMRDPTRGGLATVLNEVASGKNFGIKIYENKIPIKKTVKAVCELLGFDPLYIANEGKVVMVVSKNEAEKLLGKMKKHPLGKDAEIIGEVVKEPAGKVYLETVVGGLRILDTLISDQLPRIC